MSTPRRATSLPTSPTLAPASDAPLGGRHPVHVAGHPLPVAGRHPARVAGRAVAAAVALLALLLPFAAPASAATGVRTLSRGATGADVRAVQQQLVVLGLLSVRPDGNFGPRTQAGVDRFQEKFGLPRTRSVDAATRARLQQLARRGPALDPRCRSGVVICVDKTQKILRLVRNGRVVQAADARFGARGMETREGRFSVTRKSRNHVSSLYGSRMPYALFFSGGQAVHYSPEFAAKGYRGGSHGCVNLRDRSGAAALFDAVRVGTPVVVYRS